MDSVNSELFYGLMRDMLKINFEWEIRMFSFCFEIAFDLLIHLYFLGHAPQVILPTLYMHGLGFVDINGHCTKSPFLCIIL